MDEWLQRLPKAELHLHIEGSLMPEQMLELAQRNSVSLPYDNVDEVNAAYQFDRLQDFLDLYYQGMSVLHSEQDFHDLAMAYFRKAHEDGVVHAELSFDPQAHTIRGVALAVPFEGLLAAMRDAEREFGISSALIMSFLRDRDAGEALETLEQAEPWYGYLSAVGLDSAEQGNPPEKFADVFARARELGLPRTAHAGEEGPPAYISGALDVLDVCRIDHGVSCMQDAGLVERLRASQIPLTVCPLSNVCLGVVDELAQHPLPQMLEAGLNVSLNSDDPAYFGGGMQANFEACRETFGWQREDFRMLATNAVNAAFMAEDRRRDILDRIVRS